MLSDELNIDKERLKANLEDFFVELYQLYLTAKASSSNAFKQSYLIADAKVNLCFANVALKPLITLAIEHLATNYNLEADLTVFIADSLSTSITIPKPNWLIYHYKTLGDIGGLLSKNIYLNFDLGHNALTLINFEQKQAIYWIESPDRVPDYELGIPLYWLWHYFFSPRQIFMLHAGAVGFKDGGVLIIGYGGAGKSNSCLSCLNSALFYLSDDYCLVKSEPTPTAYSIYATGKTHAHDLDKLPFLKSIVSNPANLGKEKAVYFLYKHYKEKIILHFPIKAILIPQVTGLTDTKLEKTSAIEGIKLMVPQQISRQPSAGREIFQNLAKIFRQVPCYQLNVGTDRQQIPEKIINLLKELK